MTDAETVATDFGPNDWLVDEMYRRYVKSPDSVTEGWRDFFDGYTPRAAAKAEAAPRATDAKKASADGAETAPTAEAKAPPTPTKPAGATELKGIASVIAKNMASSLVVPTATSTRTVAAKLLEENRFVINEHLTARLGGKVSFTHLVGYAIVRALDAADSMNVHFADLEGKPHVVQNEHINFGLAVDTKKSDGSRSLVVPNIKAAETMDFASFWAAYEELIRKVRASELTADDYAGTTMTLTNPGMIGTTMSVPRLMEGQGLIVGTGAIDFPTEYKGADPKALATMGVGKVMVVTSTYDHRVIQGAQSGEFLNRIAELLAGEEDFYDEVFASLKIPHEPLRWSRDANLGSQSDIEKNLAVTQLINMFRVRGHLLADLNPLVWEPRSHIELEPSWWGLSVWDLDREFITSGLAGRESSNLRDVLRVLRDAYSRTVGIEYMHIQEHEQKRWIQLRVEGVSKDLALGEKKRLLERLNAAEAFERFLATKYVGHKRFGLEGAESLIPMLTWLLDSATESSMREVAIGMAHRGRLNVLTNIVGKSFEKIFKEFEGDIDPETTQGSGDVKYHLGQTGTYASPAGVSIEVSVAANPSHLEAVGPVLEGVVRAKQDEIGLGGIDQVLPVLLHGDAAFAGQGVVAETLNMSQLPGYKTGGTIHIVVNNIIGFTTPVESARSSVYATDVAKMVQAPIIHVNADDPEACVFATRLAFDFRQQFHKDVVVDLVCYRRFGHNEADEPTYTQPLMYSRIDHHRSARKLYTELLVNRGDISIADAEEALEDFRSRLEGAFDQTKASRPPTVEAPPPRPPQGARPLIETGVDRGVLTKVMETMTSWPQDFTPHPKLARLLEKQAKSFEDDSIEWTVGEALAIGSILSEGRLIRFAGQDTRRGTFSQRHAVLVDNLNGVEYIPLASVGGIYRIYDSLLSEYAALGFEYGYSVATPSALVMWEAQFGDFMNGAQVVIDQYIVASEDKWGQMSSVVLLLPHGFEGQGPEHSSARMERFLMLCAEDNIQVAYPTTPAQYFHLLRRQAIDPVRKPLVVFTPKSLLRSPRVRSSVSELENGSYKLVIAKDVDDPVEVRRVILATGKICVDLDAEIEKRGLTSVCVVRVEQLYPFPHLSIDEAIGKFPSVEDVMWVQEEPENMGAWRFVFTQIQHQFPNISVVARPESGSPATGSTAIHHQEQQDLLDAALEGL